MEWKAGQGAKLTIAFGVVLATTFGAATIARAAVDISLSELIRGYLEDRGASVQIAPSSQLARRYSIDLNGVVPAVEDLQIVSAMDEVAMFDYFRTVGALPHTNGEAAYAWTSLLKDADHFLFSNNAQFSQVAHIREFQDQLRRLYVEDWSYLEFTRWALESQMFLNRFPSGADRANAAFFLFLGRDSFSSEVPLGNMWNGYQLANRNSDPGDADYHVYDYDSARCDDGSCQATIWRTSGSTPAEAIELIVGSPMFAEATVDRYWLRYIGTPLPGVGFPDLRRTLVAGFVASNYSIGWLTREIMISPAYTQEMMFR